MSKLSRWQSAVMTAVTAAASMLASSPVQARPLYDFTTDKLADGVSGLDWSTFERCIESTRDGSLFTRPESAESNTALAVCMASFSGGDTAALLPKSPALLAVEMGDTPTDCTLRQYTIRPQFSPTGELEYALHRHEKQPCVSSYEGTEVPGVYLADGREKINPSPVVSESWFLSPYAVAYNQNATSVQVIHGYGTETPGKPAYPEWEGLPSIPHIAKRGGSAGCLRLTADGMQQVIDNTDAAVAAFRQQGIVFDGEGYNFMPIVFWQNDNTAAP